MLKKFHRCSNKSTIVIWIGINSIEKTVHLFIFVLLSFQNWPLFDWFFCSVMIKQRDVAIKWELVSGSVCSWADVLNEVLFIDLGQCLEENMKDSSLSKIILKLNSTSIYIIHSLLSPSWRTVSDGHHYFVMERIRTLRKRRVTTLFCIILVNHVVKEPPPIDLYLSNAWDTEHATCQN